MSAPDDLAEILHLDWHGVLCQQDGCTRHATGIVELHVVDYCNSDELNRWGNAVLILCGRCLADAEMEIGWMLERQRRFGRPMCLTCGAPVVQLSDVVRGRRPL